MDSDFLATEIRLPYAGDWRAVVYPRLDRRGVVFIHHCEQINGVEWWKQVGSADLRSWRLGSKLAEARLYLVEYIATAERSRRITVD